MGGGAARGVCRMPNPEPHRLPATIVARRVEDGDLTAEAVVRSCLDWISEREPVVRAWTHLADAAALDAARACDKGPARGVLRGVPFGGKALFHARGTPTRHGS